ncbi:hypothetical protein ACVIGB_000080 [Bradyrhizobium sp. USDA 4341]
MESTTCFRLDLAAPKLAEDIERLNRVDVEGILKGAFPVCESIQDNDMERWHLTRAGQLVRQTGLAGDRYYVWPLDEGLDFLDGFADEEVMVKVKSHLTDGGIEIPQRPALRM